MLGLAAMRVLSCACGVWHTAAVVQERPDGGAEALSKLTYLEGRTLQAKLADMYDVVDEVSLLWAVRGDRLACTLGRANYWGRAHGASLIVGRRPSGLIAAGLA